MSDYDDLLALQDEIHDGFLGEGWTVETPTAANPADPQKRRPRGAPVAFTGIETTGHSPARAHNAEGHAESSTRRIAAERLSVDYRADTVPFPVMKGYVVTRLADGILYEVAEVSYDGASRTTLGLTARTRALA